MRRKPGRRSFDRQFKIEAVRQVLESDRTMSEIAAELGIQPGLLGRWKQQLLAEQQEAFPGKGRLKASDEEVRRLERENRELRQELEFLKKTAAYFAKERSRGLK
jgi:transposase